jgi:hypothetical protein
MKDSYKCYEKVLIVIVTAIVLCFSVHVRASGVGNKESAQEIVNEYFSLIGNDWDKFAELYTNEQINSFKNFLENEKNIREYVGVLNVRKAKLIESIEIKYDDVKDMIDEDYTGKKIKIFAVGADYDVYTLWCQRAAAFIGECSYQTVSYGRRTFYVYRFKAGTYGRTVRSPSVKRV